MTQAKQTSDQKRSPWTAVTRHRLPQRDSSRARSRPSAIPACCLFLLNLASSTTHAAPQSTSSHYTNGPSTADFGGGSSTSLTYS